MPDRWFVLLSALFSLAFALPAIALPVEVAFSGSVTRARGTPPDGTTLGTPFTATIGWDPGADQDPHPERIELPSAAFSLELDLGGAAYEFASQSTPIVFSREILWLDEDGELVDPDDPGANIALRFAAHSTLRHIESDSILQFGLQSQVRLIPPDLPDYVHQNTLPQTAADAAVLLTNDFEYWFDHLYLVDVVDGRDIAWYHGDPSCRTGDCSFELRAAIESAAPIPEPTTGSLVLLGFVGLCVGRRSTTR